MNIVMNRKNDNKKTFEKHYEYAKHKFMFHNPPLSISNRAEENKI